MITTKSQLNAARREFNRTGWQYNLSAVEFAALYKKGARDFTGCAMQRADLRGLNFDGVCFLHADLREADLRDTDLRDTDLRGAKLFDTDLRGAMVPGGLLLIAESYHKAIR